MKERLSPLDVAFLHVEDRDNRMHLAGVLCFDGPSPSYDEFRTHIAATLPQLPHFRQHLVPSVFGLGRPCWQDDPSFDLDRHLHHIALPAPGGHDQLAELIDDMAGTALDMRRPVWEMSLVEGVGDGFGIALKVHHCMVDGLSIMDAFAALCSPADDAPADDAPTGKSPEDNTTTGQDPTTGARPPTAVVAPVRDSDDSDDSDDAPSLWRTAVELVRRARRAAAMTRVAPDTVLNRGAPGPTRRTAFLRLALADALALRTATDTTLNNVMLAVVSGALRRYLDRHGESVETVNAFVPVNRRAADARGSFGNQIGMTYPALPVGENDPRGRLEKVKAAVAHSHDSSQADDTVALLRLGRFAPQPLTAVLNRAMQFRAGVFNLTVTNVPGPPVPVYLLGRRLRLILGATPLTRKHALTIAILSYDGELIVSVTTDPRRLPDGSDLTDDIEAEFTSLQSLVQNGSRHD